MPFTEKLKLEVKKKSAFRCCRCQNIGVDVHHIIPEKDNGPSDWDNATPLCQNCHNQFGDNPSKRKEIKQMRDWWYEKSEKIFSKQDPEVLNDINSKLEKIHDGHKESFAELKEILKNYSNQTIDMISTDLVSDSTTVIVNSAVPANTSNPYIGELIDVNNDGKKELVVDYHAGAYAVNMKVFGWDEYGEFKELGWFYATTSPYIEIKDIDEDGKIEIICSIRDPRAGVAMAVAPTTKEVYRWDKNNFIKVDEIRNWNIKDYPSAEL